jgi:hypothetical protein
MIKALAATLAPFSKREKPQDSPRLAASFIKNGRRIRGLRGSSHGTKPTQEFGGRFGWACFYWPFATIQPSGATSAVTHLRRLHAME